MSLIELILVLATLSCALTAGFVFAFSSVVMPGIGKLDDREFIRSFQKIDGTIQKGQPDFGLVWMSSVVALLLSAVIGALQLDGIERACIVVSALVYVLGVQVPTFRINVPLNNTLQRLDIDAMDTEALASARRAFEQRWVKSETKWLFLKSYLASLEASNYPLAAGLESTFCRHYGKFETPIKLNYIDILSESVGKSRKPHLT